MIDAGEALPGRDTPIAVVDRHVVLGTPIQPPFPEGIETIYLAMGCFWGAERIYWQIPGVHTTAVGYMGGWTTHPTYEETCTARTGHTESVLVAYDPAVVGVDAVDEGVLGEPRPDHPQPAGQRRRYPVPVRRVSPRPMPSSPQSRRRERGTSRR